MRAAEREAGKRARAARWVHGGGIKKAAGAHEPATRNRLRESDLTCESQTLNSDQAVTRAA